MWNRLIVGLAVCSLFSTAAFAQTQRAGETKPAAPAPVHDLTGVWQARSLSADMDETLQYPMTPWAQAKYNLSKPFGGPRIVPVAESNDPLMKCDPMGFPRYMLNELTGLEIVQLPGRLLELFQYQDVRREIWMDGRKLPEGVGPKSGLPDTTGAAKGWRALGSPDGIVPDPRWMGYSVGRWESDNTLIVDTNGIDERGWIDRYGHPHSPDMTVEERYTRADSGTVNITVTVTDPKAYTRPIEEKVFLRLLPKGTILDEQFCVPSEMTDYLTKVAEPGDAVKGK